ncbi:MAG: cupin domain-containing protein [Rhodospirillaceae bacterium]|nr:cupin domain-containing protein [Rhodospirillaceae bacterium]
MAKAKRRFPVAAPALEPLEVPAVSRTIYPPPHDKVVAGRFKRRLAAVLGLTDFGVNVTTLQAGAASAMRHWHSGNDEFIYVLDGEVTLITDAGPQLLVTGMCAGFPKGKKDGHHLVNQGDRPVTFLEVGTNHEPDLVGYPDAKLFLYNDKKGKPQFTRTPPPKGLAKAKAKKKKR